MVVVSKSANIRDVLARLGGCMEPSDFDSISPDTAKERRREVREGFETGNLYIVSLSSDIALSQGFNLSRPPAVLVNFDFPESVPLYLYMLHRRADAATRIHTFFAPGADGCLATPLLRALEDAGHEIPADLAE